ncbi:tRNA pseudouridine(38-40) synthase TruA [Hyphomicrobium sp.]|uniref:tRNA pseudouridine(38-40) synthase TruA n=1 Tax=Hyphomicrobium sp. TaxID=82 RepID=UPI002FDD469D
MPRYRLTIEYDGTPFVGWQIQPEGTSVQGALESAITKLTGVSAGIRGAGRTDAGVHARGQVAHVDIEKAWPADKIRDGLNFYLKPLPIVVLDCTSVSPDFDARFSATTRHYLYRILPRRAPPALERHRVWWIPRTLNAEAMREAAAVLVGRHDFTTFRASQCQAKSPLRTLDRLDVTRDGEEICIFASARSFLHNQVRSMVGSLKLVGDGKWSKEDLAQALAAQNRAACGPVAPAAGLYLMSVDYDRPLDEAPRASEQPRKPSPPSVNTL